jgi:hypothetical protein
MAARNGKYSVVEPSDNWTGTSVKDVNVAVALDTEVIWGQIGEHLPEFYDKVASFDTLATALPMTKAPVTSPSMPPEPYQWSPTQQEVDSYINSLESEVSQEGLRPRQQRVEQRGVLALVAIGRLSNYSGLFWCAVATAVACVWWLSLLFD